MDTIRDLRKTELELKQLHQSISGQSNLKDKEELTIKAKQLDFDLETAVMNLFEKTDKAYDSIVQENFDLLVNDRIKFIVTREETDTWKSHATKFEGKVHDDELFYGRTTETDFAWINYYPLSYVGLINYFGEADMYMNRKKYNLLGGKVPQKFIGSINAKGGLFLEATERLVEGSGKMYVNSVVADLFFGGYQKERKIHR